MRRSSRLLLRMAGVGVCLLLPLWFNPFSTTPFEPAKVIFFQCLIGSMVLVALVSLMFERTDETLSTRVRSWIGSFRVRNPLILPVGVFAGAYILATATSFDWRLSLWGPDDDPHGLVTILCGIVLFVLMTDLLETHGRINFLVDVLLLGSIPVALYGFFQYVGLDFLSWVSNPISPTFSTLGNPNYLGAYLGMVAPFTLSRIVMAHHEERRWRSGFVLILQVGCLWLTLARGAWLGLVGGCLAFLVVLGWRWQSQKFAVAAVFALLAGSGMFVAMNLSVLHPLIAQSAVVSQEADLPPAKIDTASMSARLVTWDATLGMISDRWLLGYGPGTFTQLFGSHYPSALATIEGPDVWMSDPHNFVLRILMDAGITGLGAFLWIVLSFHQLILKTLARSTNRQTHAILAAITGSAIAFLIQAQFNPVVIVLSTVFWLVLAMGIAMCSLVRVTTLSHQPP